MKSVKGYFEDRLKNPEYKSAYLALEKEYQKKRAHLFYKLRTKDMNEDLRFLESFLIKNADSLGWLARWTILEQLQTMIRGTMTVRQGGAQDLQFAPDEPRIAASTMETSYNAGLSRLT